MIRSADKGARMSPESESSPVDRSELAIRAFPWLVAAIPIVCIGLVLIEKHWGDTKLVTYLKTGRMDGAAENFALDPEFSGNRGNIQSEESLVLESDSVDNDVEGVYINDQFGHCVDINTDTWGYPANYDPEKTEIETAWAAKQKLELIGNLGEEVVVIQGGVIRVLAVDSSELSSLANLTTICE